MTQLNIKLVRCTKAELYKTEVIQYNYYLQECQLFFNRITKNSIEKIEGVKKNTHIDYPTAKLRMKTTEKPTIILDSSRRNGRVYFLKTGVSKLQPRGLPDFVNKVALGHKYTHSFIYCLWLFSYYKGRS